MGIVLRLSFLLPPGWKRLSGDDLEHRMVLDLAWGPGQGAPTSMLRDLYVATAGGGVWDLRISSF